MNRMKVVVLFILIALGAPFVAPARAQESTWRYWHPIAAGPCQSLMGPLALNDRTLGLATALSKPGGPLRVTYVAPTGPAAAAKIKEGDLLWGSDSAGNPALLDSCELLASERAAGDSPLKLFRLFPGAPVAIPLTIQPRPRREVYPLEESFPTSIVSELVEGGRFQVGATLTQGPHAEFGLRVSVQNLEPANLLQLDEQKIFLVDGYDEQLRQYTYGEWKRSIDGLIAQAKALAQGMPNLPSVPASPPPPPAQYQINGTSSGSYTLTPLGTAIWRKWTR
jgi:hypothetical protein